VTQFSQYRDRDFSFGQAVLALRTAIGLSQVALAEYLGVSRRTVGDWEAGNSYPKTPHLKEFIELALEHQAFEAGNEAEEIRAFWRLAHQKLRLDEGWLTQLLSPTPTPVLATLFI
jgi:transcriptional regulator with XRE-family HTH domain